MRLVRLIPAVLALTISGQAFAQGWSEYVNAEDHFTVNFPGDPAIMESTYTLASGLVTPARLYTVESGPSTYMVTVVNFANAGAEDKAGAIAHAANAFRQRGGEVTYDDDANYEGMETQMLQMTNPDQTRSFIAITQPPPSAGLNKLYIVEGRAPASAPPPGHFQQSRAFRDDFNVRIRYDRDIEGNRFRVIPGSGGAPYTRRGQEPAAE